MKPFCSDGSPPPTPVGATPLPWTKISLYSLSASATSSLGNRASNLATSNLTDVRPLVANATFSGVILVNCSPTSRSNLSHPSHSTTWASLKNTVSPMLPAIDTLPTRPRSPNPIAASRALFRRSVSSSSSLIAVWKPESLPSLRRERRRSVPSLTLTRFTSPLVSADARAEAGWGAPPAATVRAARRGGAKDSRLRLLEGTGYAACCCAGGGRAGEGVGDCSSGSAEGCVDGADWEVERWRRGVVSEWRR
mmetsp:Transcript_3948/g.8990  ORF Transcript_3948/g.8990 Transcript_3948/m.8990 type:complete len:251 (+) Transcript_3948:249-1001(+)